MPTRSLKCEGIGRHWVSSRNADAGETAGWAVRSPGSSIIERASSDSRRQTDGGPTRTSLGRMAPVPRERCRPERTASRDGGRLELFPGQRFPSGLRTRVDPFVRRTDSCRRSRVLLAESKYLLVFGTRPVRSAGHGWEQTNRWFSASCVLFFLSGVSAWAVEWSQASFMPGQVRPGR